MTVTSQYAAEHFDELLAKIDSGENVLITRPGSRVLQLAPAEAPPESTLAVRDAHGRRIFGLGKGHLRDLTAEQWQELDREFEHIWDDGRSPAHS